MAVKNNYEWEFDLEEYLMTTDVSEDYVARMKTGSTIVLDDLVKEIVGERTDIRPETITMCAQLLGEKIIEKICEGHIVSTATATYTPSIPGVFIGTSGVVDATKNVPTINVSPSSALKEALKSVKLKYSQTVRSMGNARIGLVTDSTTGSTDGKITPGGIIDVTGNKIRCLNSDGTGIGTVRFLKASTREEVATVSILAINDPKRLMFNVPATLTDGEYVLQVETYFSSSSALLKQPRTIEYPINLYVGNKPSDTTEDDVPDLM